MMIKAVFMDLDNTLLHSDKSLSDYTAAVLRRCREKGIKVAFATARPARAVSLAVGGIARDGLVYHSGVVVEADGHELARHSVPAGVAKALIDAVLLRWPTAAIFLETEGFLYSNYNAEFIWPGIQFEKTDFSLMPPGPIDKVLVGRRADEGVDLPAEMAEGLRTMLPETLGMTTDRHGIAVFCQKDATKMTGVRALMNHWGIPLLYAAAFGDDMSDISMLEGVGWGVAVDNALPEVKAVADFICGGNDEDGVARWLEQHIL